MLASPIASRISDALFGCNRNINERRHPVRPPSHLQKVSRAARENKNRQTSSFSNLTSYVGGGIEKLDIGAINHLIDSMPHRLQAVIDAKGGSTKYWGLSHNTLHFHFFPMGFTLCGHGGTTLASEGIITTRPKITNRTNFFRPFDHSEKYFTTRR
jgi:hypothetical protein